MKKNILLSITILLVAFTVQAQLPWVQVHNTSSNVTAYSLASTHNGYVYAYADNKLYRSTSNGDPGTFMQMSTAPQLSANFGEIFANGPYVFLIDKSTTNGTGLWRSSDYGNTWQQYNNDFIGNDKDNLQGIVFTGGSNLILFHNGNSVDKIYCSKDNGVTWSANLNMTGQAAISVVKKGNTQYLITTATVYTSTDNGNNWNNQNVSYPPVLGKTVLLSDGSFVMKAGDTLFTSQDAITWTKIQSTGLLTGGIYSNHFIKSPGSDTLYLTVSDGTISELVYSADKGLTWVPFETGITPGYKFDNLYYAQQLHISTNGYMFATPDKGPVYRTTTIVSAPTATSIKDQENNNVTFQVFPNPCSRFINISFDKQYESADIIISDVQGKQYNTQKILAGKNDDNIQLDISLLPQGFYLLRITTPQGNAIQKFMKE